MQRICFVVASSLLAIASTGPTASAATQDAGPEAAIRARFGSFDTDKSGSLTGREVVACGCQSYDGNGDGEISWAEFFRAELQAAVINLRGNAHTPDKAGADTAYRVGQMVEVNVDGKWVSASIVGAREGQYALSRHDLSLGVTTDNEWVGAERLRPYVSKPRVATAANGRLPAAVPAGDYVCMTYGTLAMVGKLRIHDNATSSGVTRDGSGPRRGFTYEPADGTLLWAGGLKILDWTVEQAEYRPELSGKPNINLHYRRQAGGNLNSMSCTRQ